MKQKRLSSAREPGFLLVSVLPTWDNGLTSYFPVSKKNMNFKICIPAIFISTVSKQNIGHIGQDIFV